MLDFDDLVQDIEERAMREFDDASVPADGVCTASDEADGTVHVRVQLRDPSWDNISRAIDILVDLRQDYVDLLSMDYSFGPLSGEERLNTGGVRVVASHSPR